MDKDGIAGKPISEGVGKALQGEVGGLLGPMMKAFNSAGQAAGGLTETKLPTVLTDVNMLAPSANIASPLGIKRGGGKGR